MAPGFVAAGLLLVGIPIVIHILNRRRFKTVTWAAMEFLLRALKKNRRRLEFEQLILLVTRCLVLALLGLALARPVGCQNGALSMLGGHAGLSVIVIDNSYSMAYAVDRPDAKTHLDQAKKLAKGLIDQLSGGGEAVSIITTSPVARAVIEKPGYDLEAARQAVDRIQQAYGATDLAGAMQKALEIAERESRQPDKSLYLLTDATRSAWEGDQSTSLKQLGPELAKIYRVSHFNLSQGQNQWNQAVLQIRPKDNLVNTKFMAEFAADAKGFGAGPDSALEWSINDRPLQAGQPLKLDSDSAPSTGSYAFKSGGPQVVQATLAGKDPLPADNTRYRVIDVASELKVLIVEGKRGITPLEGSGAFLQVALAPTKDSGPGQAKSDSYVQPELISDLELGNKVLTNYSAVLLANVAQVPSTTAGQLEAFVKQGGTLMLFMGDLVNGDNYNKELLPRKLLPGPMVGPPVHSDEKGFFFDFKPKGVPHPYLGVFANQENSGLDTAQVFDYWRVEVPASSPVERVLNYQPAEGSKPGEKRLPDPAITVHSLELGRVLFFSTSANADWTTLPVRMAYVTLMQELLAGSVRPGDYWMNLSAGQSLEIPASIRLAGAPTLMDSAGQPVLMTSESRNGVAMYRSAPLERPGEYKLKTGTAEIPIAVNVPANEADVRTVPDEALKKALGDADIALHGAELPLQASLNQGGNDFGWKVMAFAVLTLLALECFMAMRFGHFRRSQVVRETV